jgi:CheY-like chemotaxis protein
MTAAKYILLVEDDFDLHDSLKMCLELEGHEVVSAYNGREALTYLRSVRPPRKVFLDLMMPIMNGYEVLAELDREGLVLSIPIVVLSAAEDGERTAEKYGLKFISKPLPMELLIRHCAEM